MNQTQKRLTIINLCISMTDIETIQLQIAKLRLLEHDKKIQEIIRALESKNYIKSQELIKSYIETPVQTVHQRASGMRTQKEQALIEQFDLFVEDKYDHPKEHFADIEKIAKPPQRKMPHIDFDTLLNINAEDVLSENISIKLKGDDFFQADTLKTPTHFDTGTIPRDTFFDEETSDSQVSIDDKQEIQAQEYHLESKEDISENELTTHTHEESSQDEVLQEEDTTEDALKEISSKENDSSSLFHEDRHYPPILSITQLFEKSIAKYRPLEKSEEVFPAVHAWLQKISSEGYKESEVKEIIVRIMELSKSEEKIQHSEASELLLICGITEDPFAQLILGRELFRGKLFPKNIEAAFLMIDHLAQKEYPEAICDLAQLYEYGIGTKQDRKKAKSLYETAMLMGIKRAQKHYDRLKKELGFFF